MAPSRRPGKDGEKEDAAKESAAPQDTGGDREDSAGAAEMNGSNGHTGSRAAATSSSPGDTAGSWRGLALCLVMLSLYYGPLTYFAHRVVFTPALQPKSATDAGLGGFSEERAFSHVSKLAGDIGVRTEGTQGLVDAEKYLITEVTRLKKRASSKLRVEVDVARFYSGSFNLVFLQKSMALGYQNLTNILVRVSSASADVDSMPSVLVNGHYDSSIASTGAGDCASCVATMLETLRQIIEGGLVPPVPFIFLFNGGEEIFLKAAHGFLKQHSWSETVGAFVNLEASGTKLPDLVVQSAAPWVQRVYGASVPHPMGSVISQDVFPHIPGDTDFRILAQDFDDIPGLDIMYTLNGYAYHTLLDNPKSLQKGALQVRGENLLPLLLGLAQAPELRSRAERRMARWSRPEGRPAQQDTKEDGSSSAGSAGPTGKGFLGIEAEETGTPVFFDLFQKVMIRYSHSTAVALLTALLGLIALAPVLATPEASGMKNPLQRLDQLVIGFLCYAGSWVFAVLFAVALSALRVWVTGTTMSWFVQPGSALASFAPIALVGVLLPHMLRAQAAGEDKSPLAWAKLEWSSHWGGVVGCNAVFCLGITAAGGGSGYLFFWWGALLTPSLYILRALKRAFGEYSPESAAAYLVPGALPAFYSLAFVLFTFQFLVEKMGASGTHPLPYGVYIPDLVIAAFVGFGTALCTAPFASALSRWVARGNVLRILLYASLISSIRMSLVFPYSSDTPKRLLLCRTYHTQGPNTMLNASTVLASADSNDAAFVFTHASEFGNALLATSPDFKGPRGPSQDPRVLPPGVSTAQHGGLLAWYPVTELLDRPASVPAHVWQGSERGVAFPELRVAQEEWVSPTDAGTGAPAQKRRRVLLELDGGSLSHVWCAVLNVTGPLVGWSFSDGQLPEPERARGGGPLSYIAHLAGGSGKIYWDFWLEAGTAEKLTVELAVMDYVAEGDLAKVVAAAPNWVALYAVTSYNSIYKI